MEKDLERKNRSGEWKFWKGGKLDRKESYKKYKYSRFRNLKIKTRTNVNYWELAI